MSICTGIIIAVTFHEVNHTPDTQTSAQGNHQRLKNTNRRIKKCHKKVPPKILFEGTHPRVQEMLRLSGSSVPAGQINVKGFKLLARFQFELSGKKTLYAKGVFLIKIG